MILQNHTSGKANQFNMQDKPIDFNNTEYEKFIDRF